MGFIKNLWHGGRGLAFTYWVIYVIGNVILTILVRLMDAGGLLDQPSGGLSFAFWSVLIISLIYFFYSVFCVWASANKYEGRKLWAILSKVAIGIGTIQTILGITNLLQT